MIIIVAGYVASTCNPASGRRDEVDGLRLGQLVESGACRSGVRTRPGIDMDRLEESGRSRLNQLRRDESGQTGNRAAKSPRVGR